MSVRTIDPAYLTVQQWTDFMVPSLEQFGNLGRLDRDDEWRAWGVSLLNMSQLSGSIVPNPYQFDDWRVWARRLVENLSEIP